MSDQMVPPPPPPQPPHTGGGFDTNAALNEFKGADPLDLAVVGAGVLALIFSFFSSFYTWSFSGYGYSVSTGVSAWHGFFGWAGVLLLLAAAAVTSAKIVKVAVPNGETIGAAAAVVGLLCVFLAMFIYPSSGVSGAGHGFSYWVVLILAVVSGGISGLKFARARGIMK